MNVIGLGLVPRVRVPSKLKVPTFDKYTGTTFPKTCVKDYYLKMSVYSEDERLLMNFFRDSMSGASSEWYMQLQRNYI